MIGEEIKALRNQTVQQFGGARNDLDFATILPDDMFRAQAEKRVKLGLLLNEMINQDKVIADPARVRTMIEEVASTYEDPQEVIDWYYGNRQQLQGIEAAAAEEQIVEKLLAGAKVTEKVCGYEEALKAEAATPSE
jgi:trigger factor